MPARARPVLLLSNLMLQLVAGVETLMNYWKLDFAYYFIVLLLKWWSRLYDMYPTCIAQYNTKRDSDFASRGGITQDSA
jgi:hypothetical protein